VDNTIELFDQLGSVINGVLMLQEVASWGDGEELDVDGWSIFHTSSNPSAVAVPHHLSRLVGGYCADCMCCGVSFGEHGMVSVYLPDISKPLDEYIRGVEFLRRLCADLTSKGAKYLIIGGDLQIEVQPDIPDVSGKCCSGRSSCADYWDRHSILVEFALHFATCFANTWLGNESCWNTRSHWSRPREAVSQIDYLMVPASAHS
jgi:hypothetical protein